MSVLLVQSIGVSVHPDGVDGQQRRRGEPQHGRGVQQADVLKPRIGLAVPSLELNGGGGALPLSRAS